MQWSGVDNLKFFCTPQGWMDEFSPTVPYAGRKVRTFHRCNYLGDCYMKIALQVDDDDKL